MLDARVRVWIDPPLNAAGRALARRGWTANKVTAVGLGFGLVAALVLALGLAAWLALLPLLAGRIADGLDGAVARAAGKTDFGGYFDIFCDFIFYAAIPLAFAIRDPQIGLIATFLLASFYVNAASFLGFAILAEKKGMQTRAQGEKSLYYSAGLLEGTETIVFFCLICLFPQWFGPMALVFGTLCFVTAGARSLLAFRLFGQA